jgi:hypothetical protein
MSRRDDAPRDLLFGLLALQNGLVTRDQLVAAFGAWTCTAGKPLLADVMAGQGALRPEHRLLLDALAKAHLELHGDAERSLSALDVSRSTSESLADAGRSDVEATLGRVGSAFGSTEGDPERTATYSVSSSIGEGQRFRVLRPADTTTQNVHRDSHELCHQPGTARGYDRRGAPAFVPVPSPSRRMATMLAGRRRP